MSLVVAVAFAPALPLLADSHNPPEAFDGFWNTKVDTPVFIFLDAFDVDGDPLTFSIVDNPDNGSLDDCSSGSCTYTPSAGFIGTDTFSFTANDGDQDSNVATVTVDVAENQAPEAFDTTESTPIDTPVFVFLSAFDPDGDSLTYTVTGGPSDGSLDDCSFGSCTYTPDTGFAGTDSFTFTASDGDLTSNEATVTIDVNPPCAPATCIDNGTILLAVNPEAHLNTHDATGSVAGPGDAGLHYIPTGNESTSPGCLCEGWGAADATSGLTGYANIDSDFGVNNLDLVSFSATASTAISTVDIDGELRVTHDFHPSPATNDLYEVTVTMTNLTASPLEDIRYRRVMDWDIEPTPFSEFTTINGGDAVNLLFSSNDGFASANPLAGPSDLGETGSFTDSGPDDHGALFDFGFGSLEAGESISFNIYYGASGTELAAISAVAAVGAEVFSFGQPSTTDGPTLGTPNTFIFAFAGVGGDPVFAPVAGDDSLVTSVNTPGDVDVLANDSDPNDDPLTVTGWTQGANGSVSCTPEGICTYTPDTDFVGEDSFTYDIGDGTGGTDTATVFVTVNPDTSNQPPTAEAGADTPGVEGAPIALAGSASDPDGDALTTNWSYAPDTGVDPGAGCVFGDASSLSTDLTCTDDGTYTVTLTVSDGVNPPVQDTAQVTVSNADPVVSITSPTEGAEYVVGETVNLASSIDDAGSNDTHTCSIDWGDGTVTDGVVNEGQCTGTHAYLVSGPHTILVIVTDDDGGEGTDHVEIVINDPPANGAPTADAGDDVSGTEGSAISLNGSGSDPDGDTLTYSWSYVAGAGVDPGATCSFSDAGSPSTTITCTDDGEFVVTLTVDDGVNPPVGDTATVSVSNADPQVTITSPGDGSTVNVGSVVNLSAALGDPGANDTHSCTVDWGDGTVGAGDISGATCIASHSYSTVAIPTITVTVVDDDGGTDTDEIMLIVTSPSAKVTGGGWLVDKGGNRVNFGLVAAPADHGGYDGQIQVRVHKADKFHGTDVDSFNSNGKSATWSGPGRWNGISGYSYEVTIEDRGNGKSKKGQRDLISLTIYDTSGTAVYTASGPLGGGNLKVH